MTTHDCVVVGGGFAGLSAAVRLVQSGSRPLLLERRQNLGGRAYSLTDPITSDTIDNGQHVLMRCCHAVQSFLKTIGSQDLHFEPGFSIPFVDLDGGRYTLRAPGWLPPSVGLAYAFLRFPRAGLADILGLNRVRRAFSSPPEGISFTEWLDQIVQSPAIREAFWTPLCVSVMNAHPDKASARELVSVLAEAFTHPRGSNMGWATVGLTELYTDRAAAYLEQGGGSVRLGATAVGIIQDADRFRLDLRDGSTIETDTMIVATPPPRAAELIRRIALDDLVSRLERFTPSPILGINLWFGRRVLETPFVGLLNGTIEWVFEKRALYRETAKGNHLALVVSASDRLLGASDDELVEIALNDLRTAGLIGQDDEPLHSRVIHEKQATYLRPIADPPIGAATDLPGLFLAGDWTNTGLPPTIEGAVRSGFRAAELVVEYAGRKKTPRS